MTNLFKHKSLKFIEWIVQTKSNEIIYSETFLLENCKCYFKFYSGTGNVRSPFLDFYSDEKLPFPIEVRVRIFSSSKNLATLSKSITESCTIWKKREEITSCSFDFTFYTNCLKEDKCIQTESDAEACKNAVAPIRSLSGDFSKLLETGSDHDVEMKCGGQCIKAHKIVLGARSDVFKTMLQNDMLEGRTGVVEIKDMDATYFRDFVNYLYTDTMPALTFDKAMVLYETADKYDVKGLMFWCAEYLQENLSPENAFQCYSLADAHSDETLKEKIKNFLFDKKIYLRDDCWSPFCEDFPKLAIGVYKLLHKKD